MASRDGRVVEDAKAHRSLPRAQERRRSARAATRPPKQAIGTPHSSKPHCKPHGKPHGKPQGKPQGKPDWLLLAILIN